MLARRSGWGGVDVPRGEREQKKARRQLSMVEATKPRDWTAKDEVDRKWAICCYEQRLPFRLFSSEALKEAVAASAPAARAVPS